MPPSDEQTALQLKNAEGEALPGHDAGHGRFRGMMRDMHDLFKGDGTDKASRTG